MENDNLKVLKKLYDAQKESFFPFSAVPMAMEKTGLSEDEILEYLEYFVEQGWLKRPSHRLSFFRREGYIKTFPVTLTAKGISVLKEEK